jgi:hypothetical protein
MKALLVLTIAILALAVGGTALGAEKPQGYRFITDTLAPGGGGAAQQQGYTFITDTLAPGGGASSVSSSPAPAFSWGDAGVGAGFAAGVLLVTAGGTLTVLRRRQRLAL